MADASVDHARDTTCYAGAWYIIAYSSWSIVSPSRYEAVFAYCPPKLLQVLLQTWNAPCTDRRNSALLRIVHLHYSLPKCYRHCEVQSRISRLTSTTTCLINNDPTPHIAREQRKKPRKQLHLPFVYPTEQASAKLLQVQRHFCLLLADHQVRAPRKSLAVPVWAIRLGPVPAGCACSYM